MGERGSKVIFNKMKIQLGELFGLERTFPPELEETKKCQNPLGREIWRQNQNTVSSGQLPNKTCHLSGTLFLLPRRVMPRIARPSLDQSPFLIIFSSAAAAEVISRKRRRKFVTGNWGRRTCYGTRIAFIDSWRKLGYLSSSVIDYWFRTFLLMKLVKKIPNRLARALKKKLGKVFS